MISQTKPAQPTLADSLVGLRPHQLPRWVAFDLVNRAGDVVGGGVIFARPSSAARGAELSLAGLNRVELRKEVRNSNRESNC